MHDLGLLRRKLDSEPYVTATPTCYCLEWVDWAERILAELLWIVNGDAIALDRPGNGLVWSKKAVERWRM